mgnify:CR=1 FL=1
MNATNPDWAKAVTPINAINKNTIGNGEIGPITQILRETYIKISKHNSI